MEEDILKDVLPNIKTTDKLIEFANNYNIWQLKSVKERFLYLQRQELVQAVDLPAKHKRPSDSPGPSNKRVKVDGKSQLSGSLDNLSVDSLFDIGEEELDYNRYLDSSVTPNDLNTYVNQVGAGPSVSKKPYHFKLRRERSFAENAATEKIFQISFNDQWKGQKLVELHENLHDMFEDVLQEGRGNLEDNDLGRVVIRHQNLENPIVVPLRPLEELNADVVLSHIENVLKSHQNLPLDDSVDIDVGFIQVPKGSDRHNISNVHESVKQKLSVVEIKSTDHMCLARSLAVCFAKAHTVSKSEWESVLTDNPLEQCECRFLIISTNEKKNTHENHLELQHKKCPPNLYTNLRKYDKQQTHFAKFLCDQAGVSQERPACLHDLPKFEAVLRCQILVVSASQDNILICKGKNDDRKQLFVYSVNDNHFHAIPNISGFFGQSYFRHHKEKHECENHCRVCKRKSCRQSHNQVICQDCHMQCRSEACFNAHKKTKKSKKGNLPSECEKYWRCPKCFKVFSGKEKEKHVCDQYKCQSCQKMVDFDHLCYQKPIQNDDKRKVKKFLLYDFECSQEELTSCQEGYVPTPCSKCGPESDCTHYTKCANCNQSWCGRQEHRPNFVIAQSVCDICKDKPLTPGAKCDSCGSRCRVCNKWNKKCFKTAPCVSCGQREVKFQGVDTSVKFCAWLFTKSHKDFRVYAHNGRSYDTMFLLDFLIQNSILPDKIVYNGSKLMYIHVPRGLNIELLDSLSYFNTKLSNLLKMFHLKELKKEYFPHYFNTEGHQNYVGPYPDPKYYGVDTMSTEGRTDFLKWYAEQKHKIFYFAQEMEDYCRSVVQILREALI